MSTRFNDATYERQIRELTSTMEPRIRAEFLAAMNDIKSRAQIDALVGSLRSNDIQSAINAINIDPGAFAKINSLVIETYGKAGVDTISSGNWIYPNGQRAVVRFNSLSPRSEAWAREQSANLVFGLSDEAKSVARDVIADGYALGRRTDRIALDLVGRIGANGRRVGGVVGLDPQSEQWVKNLRGYLETDIGRALGMKLNNRDKDTLRRLISAGKTLTAPQIDNLLRRYENNLLMSRGRKIGRTETINAIEMGKYEAWKQGLEKTGIPEKFIVRKWVHTGRALRDRPDHVIMNGDEKRGLQSPHTMPDGVLMLHPHDTSYGAGPNHIVHCECREDYRIDKKGLKLWRASQGL